MKGVKCNICGHTWTATAKELRCPKLLCRSYDVKRVALNANNKCLTYKGLYALLKRLFERADVKKKFNPHLFRHSRATELANKLTEAQMKEIFGWTQGSKMAATYVHLSGRDVDNALLKMHGLLEEEETDEGFKAIKCPRCKQINVPKSRFCSQCSMTLDIKTAIGLEEKREKADKFVANLVKDPQILKALLKKVQESDLGEQLQEIL